MKKLLIALAFAGLLATPAMAQSYGAGPSGGRSSDDQSGALTAPPPEVGTDDQKGHPNAACPPGSTNPECEQSAVPERNQNQNGEDQEEQDRRGEDQGDTNNPADQSQTGSSER